MIWSRESLYTEKEIGRMGWLEARPLVKRAPLMHWIEKRRREKDELHLIQV